MGASSVNIIELHAQYLALAVGGPAILWALAVRLPKILSPSSGSGSLESEKEKDWSIPAIDFQAQGSSLFHCWDPRIKIVALVLHIFCVASLTQPIWAFCSLVLAVGSVAAARIPFRYPLRRLTAMSGFLGMLLVVMPITVPARNGDTLIVFTHLTFVSLNIRGLALAVLICLKASAMALMVEPLLATSPFSVSVQALADLKVPQVICQMILLTHRYIFVFQHEASRMGKGMKARGFKKRTDADTLRTIGNFLGMLLVRSFERTQRVYEAMLARGYNGALPGGIQLAARRSDWVKGACWVGAGLAILIVDRAWKTASLRFF